MVNIALIGYRGSGKTTVAKLLSKKLNLKVINTDSLIEEKVKMPISDYVKTKGWDNFREVESKIVADIREEGCILDCGGGLVLRQENVYFLKKNSVIFYLEASPKIIKERLKGSYPRPALYTSSIDEIDYVLERRSPLYSRVADYVVNTDNESATKAVDEILGLLSINRTITCISLASSTVAETIKDLEAASKKAEIIEIRLDMITDIDERGLIEILEKKQKKIIVTCLKNKKIDEKKLFRLYHTAIDHHADYVSLSCKLPIRIIKTIIKNKRHSEVIVSYHDFKKTPKQKDLERKYDELKELGPDIVKIVTYANSINDNFRVFEFLKGKKKVISFCMGRHGEISRVLAAKYGSYFTYSTINDRLTAPGQLSFDVMKHTYNIDRIHGKTNVLGVIGEHAENSLSKHMHNAIFNKQSFDYVYLPFKTEKKELARFMSNFKRFGFSGAAVTMPHKETIMQYLDEVDETAKRIGAVNTIVSKDNRLIGYNTDYIGVTKALNEKTVIKGKKVLIIGAGGAARAVAYSLKKEGAIATIINRTDRSAKNLAEEFDMDYDKFSNIKKAVLFKDLIINATSVGMSPDEDDNFLSVFPKNAIVMDLVYKPRLTKFIKTAESFGCKTITGERVLIYQALGQFELWTGTKPVFKEMENALYTAING